MQKGRFISFEGSEGCGKSTQIQLLAKVLDEAGIRVLQTREPGGTAVGEQIRDLLQHSEEAAAMTPESELLLFAASRAQLVREVIGPALDEGQWVIADRFLDSTTVYQGQGRGLDLDAVRKINQLAIGDVMPDLTLLLDMDATAGHQRAAAASRAEGKSDRMEDQPLEFFERVRQGYLDLAAAETERIAVVDASGSIDQVHSEITAIVKNRYDEFSA